MTRLVLLGALSLGAATFAGCAGTAGAPAAPGLPPATTQSTATSARSVAVAGGRFAHVCDAARAGEASCHSIIDTATGEGHSPQGKVGGNATSPPAGFGPNELQNAYGLPTGYTTGSAITGPVIGIVDAYNAATLESDLAVYRAQYGLPECSTANGCFRKVNQTGGTTYPKNNASWGQETSLDVDMVSANCPTCKILVVEANSPSFTNLGTAVNTAVALGAYAVSNSYGGAESSGQTAYAGYYNHAGVAITASSGDSGYGAQSPASFGTVVATGGTNLSRSSTPRGWSEFVWSGAGSGCSAYAAQEAWQTQYPGQSLCANRIVADVAYDSDPNTGVAVYDSTAYRGSVGWLVFGGTSVASPAIAAVYGLANDILAIPTVKTSSGAIVETKDYPATKAYANKASLNDVTSGSNGSCGGTYLCTGFPGYDGPTGLGTPNGIAAF